MKYTPGSPVESGNANLKSKPIPQEELDTRKDLFLNFGNHLYDLGFKVEEVKRIREMDIAGRSVPEIKKSLRKILGTEERTESAWQEYLAFRRRDATRTIVKDLLNHPEKSGPLMRFMDWDSILEQRPPVIVKKKGDILLTKETAGKHFFVILHGVVRYSKRDKKGEEIKSADNVPYDYFGEQEILNKKITNSENRVTSDKAVLFQIEPSVFLEAMQKGKIKAQDILKEKNIAPDILEQLVEKGRINVFRKYHSIVSQSKETTTAQPIRILLSGSAFFLRDSKNCGPVQVGDFIGLMEHEDPAGGSPASVITDQDCVVLEIQPDDFDEILKKNPSFDQQLLKTSKKTEAGLNEKTRKENVSGKMAYRYEFTRLTKPEQKEVKEEILRVALDTVSMISDYTKENRNEERLKDLFAFICETLERQEDYDSKLIFVSHGAMHSVHVLKFAEAVIEGSPTFQKNIQNIFGLEKGRILLRLAAIFHDIGYPDYIDKKEAYKWSHQGFSADRVEERFDWKTMREMMDVRTKDYELFLEAIAHHGSDTSSQASILEGRPFLTTSNEINPLLVALRFADNLDLIEDRLTKLQRDEQFSAIIEKFYKACEEPDGKGGVQGKKDAAWRKKEMRTILDKQWQKLDQADPLKKNWLAVVRLNLEQVIERDDWEAYHHFESVRIAQNVFIKEDKEKSTLTIFVEYNQPESQLSMELIDFQTGRLRNSIKSSLEILTPGKLRMRVEIKQIFPIPTPFK